MRNHLNKLGSMGAVLTMVLAMSCGGRSLTGDGSVSRDGSRGAEGLLRQDQPAGQDVGLRDALARDATWRRDAPVADSRAPFDAPTGDGAAQRDAHRDLLPNIDGLVVDGPPRPDALRSDIAPDACVRPPKCADDHDCGAGYRCHPCAEDPCCPMCAVCYPRCVPLDRCANNAHCAKGYYCNMPAGVCFTSGTMPGTCAARPAGCTRIYDPVCGCDGKTYGNPCEAARAGISVKTKGSCPQDAACKGVTCAVHDDCCQCSSYEVKAGQPPPPSCPRLCIVSTCSSWRLQRPVAYCSAGACLLGDQNEPCQNDGDCQLYSDCCSCAAFAKSTKLNLPTCNRSCIISHCASLGITRPRAACIAGVCQVRGH